MDDRITEINENTEFTYTERYDEAYDAAVNYLAVCPRSEKEVVERLYKKGFHKNEVENAVERAKGYHYIDDTEFCKAYIESYKNKSGAKKILYKLTTEKGINKILAENLLADIFSEEEETEIALNIAIKYCKQKKVKAKDRAKIGAYLYQKGYSSNISSKVINLLFDEGVFNDDFEN